MFHGIKGSTMKPFSYPNTHPFMLSAMLLAAWISIQASFSFAGQVIIIDADKQYEYAGKLFREGAFEQAITEYRRFLDFFPKDERSRSAQFKIGSAYYHAKRYNDAITALESVIRADTIDALTIKSYQTVSDCYLKLGQATPGVTTLEKLMNRVDDKNLKDQTRYAIGWIFLDQLDFDRAVSSFNQIEGPNRNKYRIDALIPEIETARSMEDKDPTLAGLLSVIPGGGYLYLERYRDALISFLINGALIYAAYESFNNDLYVLGGIISVVGVGFYAGNIYGATTSAHKSNRSQKQNFIDNLKQQTTFGLIPDSQFDGVRVAFRYQF